MARQVRAQLGAVGGLRGERWVKPRSAEHVTPTRSFRGLGQGPPEKKGLGTWCPRGFEKQLRGSRMREGVAGGGGLQGTLTIRAEGEGVDTGLQWQWEGSRGPPPDAMRQDGCEYMCTQSAEPPGAGAPGALAPPSPDKSNPDRSCPHGRRQTKGVCSGCVSAERPPQGGPAASAATEGPWPAGGPAPAHGWGAKARRVAAGRHEAPVEGNSLGEQVTGGRLRTGRLMKETIAVHPRLLLLLSTRPPGHLPYTSQSYLQPKSPEQNTTSLFKPIFPLHAPPP